MKSRHLLKHRIWRASIMQKLLRVQLILFVLVGVAIVFNTTHTYGKEREQNTMPHRAKPLRDPSQASSFYTQLQRIRNPRHNHL